jgi:hypothetical protein
MIKKIALVTLMASITLSIHNGVGPQRAEVNPKLESSPKATPGSLNTHTDALEIVRTIQQLEQSAYMEVEALPTSIPFQYKGGHIILSGNVNRTDHDAYFIFDSGARTSLLDRDYFQDSQLKSKIFLDSKTSYSLLETIDFSGVTFSKLGAFVVDFITPENPLRCLSDAGLLGANAMRHGVWQIDYQTQQITPAKHINQLGNQVGTLRFPFELVGDRPAIKLPIPNGPSITAIIDTGWEGGIYLSTPDFEAAKEHLIRPKITFQSLTATLDGVQNVDFELATIPCLKIGECLVNYPVMGDRHSDLHAYSLIGNHFLEQFQVTLDWQEQMLYLKPVALHQESVQNKVGYGFQVMPQGNQLWVTGLFSPSPAEQAGLRVGDRILAIDNVNYGYISDTRFCETILSPPKTQDPGPLTITTQRQGAVRTYTLDSDPNP